RSKPADQVAAHVGRNLPHGVPVNHAVFLIEVRQQRGKNGRQHHESLINFRLLQGKGRHPRCKSQRRMGPAVHQTTSFSLFHLNTLSAGLSPFIPSRKSPTGTAPRGDEGGRFPETALRKTKGLC